jgi:hypothetical protein
VRQRTSIRDDPPGALRPCGFAFTTTGRPCAHLVAEGELYCRAGHPCPPRPPAGVATRHAARPHPTLSPPTRPRGDRSVSGPDRIRRAAELLARSLSHDDAEADGIVAERILADPEVALTFLGSHDAAPAARDAVVQRFGLVGALLVVGHEDRLRRHLAALAAGAESSPVPEADRISANLERLVRHFPHLDARELASLLDDIDRVETGAPPDALSSARHRLHAAYAVAARDSTDASHHEYMESLNEVLRMTRPAVA